MRRCFDGLRVNFSAEVCQANPECAQWSYLADIEELGPLRARCFLKTAAAARVRSHEFVVSGDRVCPEFREALSGERTGLEHAAWVTAPVGKEGSAPVAV